MAANAPLRLLRSSYHLWARWLFQVCQKTVSALSVFISVVPQRNFLFEIRLDKSRTGVNIDLPQDRVPRVNEAVGRGSGDNDDVAGVHFVRLVAHGDRGAAFKRERDLDIRMRV